MMSTEAEYGTWKSPISSVLATKSAVSFQEIHVDKSGQSDQVFWTELRAEEEGRYVVCSAGVDPDSIQVWSPKDFSARSMVHEYGGGASFVHDGTLYFLNFLDQRLYAQNGPEAEPLQLTPLQKGWRYADGCYCPKYGKLYYVREDHGLVKTGERKEAENTIVVFDPVSQDQNILVSGADFYSSPKVSPDGKHIAWVQWVHPNMPWDTTELWLADLSPTGDGLVEGSAKRVAGGDDVSVIQPSWTPDNQLLYIGDQTEWWNLYLVAPSGEHINLHQVEQEIGGAHWVFANYGYDVDPRNTGLIATLFGGTLGLLNMHDKSYRVLDTGYSRHRMVQFGHNGMVFCEGGSPTSFPAVIRVNTENGQVSVIKHSRTLTVDDGYLTVPQDITWEIPGSKEIVHGYFYPPKNKDFHAPAGALPPLLVRAHGGPTDQTHDILSLSFQYFTSRGFACLDVNYRGSTGYGKKYRHRLYTNWGVTDVEDCCAGALYLAEKRFVDPERLCIDGGSAGGYTTLACLAFNDVFQAGASHYGIGDVEVLMQDTHKFESRYLDTLICPYKEENLPIIHARSPIKHINKFNCPVIFFQGDQDMIVPQNQAEMMFDAVKAKGIPCAFVLFEGEQHGFRKAENIQKALDGQFYFFGKVFNFKPADDEGEIPISNLPQ